MAATFHFWNLIWSSWTRPITVGRKVYIIWIAPDQETLVPLWDARWGVEMGLMENSCRAV